MRREVVLSFPLALGMVIVPGVSLATTIVWTNVLPGPVYAYAGDRWGNPLPGTATFGAPDLSKGALVQLWKATGAIDDPRGVDAAYASTDWSIDDGMPLQEINIGFSGFFPENSGLFSGTVDAPLTTGDVVYARVYNLPKGEWVAAALSDRQVDIRNADGEIVSFEIGDPMAIHTFYFENLRTEVPEPASLLVLVPGVGIWALRRKK